MGSSPAKSWFTLNGLYLQLTYSFLNREILFENLKDQEIQQNTGSISYAPIFFGCRVIGVVSGGVGLLDVEWGGDRVSGYLCYKTNKQASKQNIYYKIKRGANN